MSTTVELCRVKAELAALRAEVGRVADEWSSCWCPERRHPDEDPRVQDCPQHGDATAQHMADGVSIILRNLLDADA